MNALVVAFCIGVVSTIFGVFLAYAMGLWVVGHLISRF